MKTRYFVNYACFIIWNFWRIFFDHLNSRRPRLTIFLIRLLKLRCPEIFHHFIVVSKFKVILKIQSDSDYKNSEPLTNIVISFKILFWKFPFESWGRVTVLILVILDVFEINSKFPVSIVQYFPFCNFCPKIGYKYDRRGIQIAIRSL